MARAGTSMTTRCPKSMAARTLGTVGPVPTRMLNTTNSSCRVLVCFAESSEAHRDSPMWRKPLSMRRACRKKLRSTDCPAVLQLPSLGKNVTEVFCEVMKFLQVCHSALENTRIGKVHALKCENLLEQHEKHRCSYCFTSAVDKK